MHCHLWKKRRVIDFQRSSAFIFVYCPVFRKNVIYIVLIDCIYRFILLFTWLKLVSVDIAIKAQMTDKITHIVTEIQE